MRNAPIALFFIIGSAVLDGSTASFDYCERSLCPWGGKHIACGNNGRLSNRCSRDAQIIPMTRALQTLLTNKHNELRNEIACGGIKGYEPAVRMAPMRWNPELAAIAELNVKQCEMEHDECRNTRKFSNVGQNLAYSGWYGSKRTVAEVALRLIQSWFNEHKDASMASIRHCRELPTGKAIGHFTQMVQDQATDLGCAILRQTQGKFLYQYLSCNYAYGNMQDAAVYASGGKPASACRTGTHPQYKFLCSEREIYNYT